MIKKDDDKSRRKTGMAKNTIKRSKRKKQTTMTVRLRWHQRGSGRWPIMYLKILSVIEWHLLTPTKSCLLLILTMNATTRINRILFKKRKGKRLWLLSYHNKYNENVFWWMSIIRTHTAWRSFKVEKLISNKIWEVYNAIKISC